MSQTTPYNATGRRKTAIAHAWLTEGSGRITINRRGFEEYLPTVQLQNAVLQPFQVTNTMNKFDVNVVTKGGGIHGQVGAIRMAIARALVQVDEAFRSQLREFGLLTRDSRMKERKKPGRPGAASVISSPSVKLGWLRRNWLYHFFLGKRSAPCGVLLFCCRKELCFLLLSASLKSLFWLDCLRRFSMIFLHLL